MTGLSEELYICCREILSKCHEFDDDGKLKALFAVEDLRPYEKTLHEASRKIDRVDQFIKDFILLRSSTGQSIFITFLKTVRDRQSEEDSLRNELDNLLQQVQMEIEPVVEVCVTESTPVPTRLNPFGPLAQRCTKGLDALDRMARQFKEVRDEIISRRALFDNMCIDLHYLHCLKKLHDAFEYLQTIHENTVRISRSFKNNEMAWEETILWIRNSECSETLDNISKIADDEEFNRRENPIWKQRVNLLQNDLLEIADKMQPEDRVKKLDDINNQLTRLLGEAPKGLNRSLAVAARASPLSMHIRALKDVGNSLERSKIDSGILQAYDECLSALDELSDTQYKYVECHDFLQEISTELDPLRVMPTLTLDDLDADWVYLHTLLIDVCGRIPQRERSRELERNVRNLARTISASNEKEAIEYFSDLSHLIGDNFKKVDRTLLDLCEVLDTSVGQPLKRTVRRLG